jgi:uncharacterized protein YuzE
MEKIMDKLNMESLKRNANNFVVKYDSKCDTLYAYLKNAAPAISYDCGGDFWLRVNPENGEIVGFEIEAYKKSFMRKYKKDFEEYRRNTEIISTRYLADKLTNELAGCLS